MRVIHDRIFIFCVNYPFKSLLYSWMSACNNSKKSPMLSSTSSSSRTAETFSTLDRALGVQLLLLPISIIPILITVVWFSNGSVLCNFFK